MSRCLSLIFYFSTFIQKAEVLERQSLPKTKYIILINYDVLQFIDSIKVF